MGRQANDIVSQRQRAFKKVVGNFWLIENAVAHLLAPEKTLRICEPIRELQAGSQTPDILHKTDFRAKRSIGHVGLKAGIRCSLYERLPLRHHDPRSLIGGREIALPRLFRVQGDLGKPNALGRQGEDAAFPLGQAD